MRDVNLENELVFSLNGSSHERRKKYRKILRLYPNAHIEKRSAKRSYKQINGKREVVEDANSPQTEVVVRYNLGSGPTLFELRRSLKSDWVPKSDAAGKKFSKAKVSVLCGKPLWPQLISGKSLCR